MDETDLHVVDQVEELRVCQEHDGKDDAEPEERLGAVAQRRRQHAHASVEAQQLDELSINHVTSRYSCQSLNHVIAINVCIAHTLQIVLAVHTSCTLKVVRRH